MIYIYIFGFQLNSVLCGNDTHLIYYTTWGLSTLADNPLTSFWRRCRGMVKNWKLNFVSIALWITDFSCDCNLLLDSGWCIWEIKGKKNSCYLIPISIRRWDNLGKGESVSRKVSQRTKLVVKSWQKRPMVMSIWLICHQEECWVIMLYSKGLDIFPT